MKAWLGLIVLIIIGIIKQLTAILGHAEHHTTGPSFSLLISNRIDLLQME